MICFFYESVLKIRYNLDYISHIILINEEAMKSAFITPVLIILIFCAACISPTINSTPTAAPQSLPENTMKANVTPNGMISVEELKASMENEDIFLVNVHIPFEGNIPGTDLFVPYNEINENISLFPVDKDHKIVVYCKAGSMGKDAAQALIALGYTNVWNLSGGYEAWKEAGLSFKDK